MQDAILADPVRGPAVSVVELKSWWYTVDGTLYAPQKGKNLAPRQPLRQCKGPRKRAVEQTARQVREYRHRDPEKALLFTQGPDDGWAVLAAGGSLPNLPCGTDRRLLGVLPRLRPVGPARATGRQGMPAEPGHHSLAYAGPGAPPRLDLSAESSSVTVWRVDPRTGRVHPWGETVPGGRVAEIPAAPAGPSVLWLTTDAKTSESPSP